MGRGNRNVGVIEWYENIEAWPIDFRVPHIVHYPDGRVPDCCNHTAHAASGIDDKGQGWTEAVECLEQATVDRQLLAANGLGNIIEVLLGRFVGKLVGSLVEVGVGTDERVP